AEWQLFWNVSLCYLFAVVPVDKRLRLFSCLLAFHSVSSQHYPARGQRPLSSFFSDFGSQELHPRDYSINTLTTR
uniref:Uncharacterized protein n=1 Tax=Parascaris univalens TaxID=6257 RepID=A0A915CB17_PARUN